jgi:hypothetical protein
MEQLGSIGGIFRKFYSWVFLEKADKEYRVLYMKTCVHLWQSLAEFFLQWEMFQTKFVQKIKAHFIFNHFFFPKVVSLWDNVDKYYRATATLATHDNIIRRNRTACWTTKAADTPTKCAIPTAFPQQKVLWKAPQRYVLWTSPVLCCRFIVSNVRPDVVWNVLLKTMSISKIIQCRW